jgi:hypothetical protein
MQIKFFEIVLDQKGLKIGWFHLNIDDPGYVFQDEGF